MSERYLHKVLIFVFQTLMSSFMTPNLSDWICRAWFLFRFRKKNGLIGKGKVETFRRTSRVPRWTPATVISSTDLEEEEVAPIDRRRTCN
ncbi:hypothetical protein F2Q70_00013785 [Brassica cretica]|uniref:Uncharacterized protein n=1 Tax=Brassica cretica TaxID=69181 RepID=A0A8S9M6E9_BRACR|nr:hypothetical protein F2Q70_00013785 [Brassica cretica]